MVGFRALWAQQLLLHGRSYTAFQPCDAATKREFRGVGVTSVLADLCLKKAVGHGCVEFFNFPNSNSLPLYKKLSWPVQKGIRRYMRVIDVGALIRGHDGLREKFVPNAKDAVQRDLDFSDCEYSPRQEYLSPRIDEKILDWRFNRHPRFSYQAARADAGELAVFRSGRRGQVREDEIVFINSRSGRALRKIVSVMASARSVDCISMIATNKLPMLAGFMPVPSSINFVRARTDAHVGKAHFDLQPLQIDVT